MALFCQQRTVSRKEQEIRFLGLASNLTKIPIRMLEYHLLHATDYNDAR